MSPSWLNSATTRAGRSFNSPAKMRSPSAAVCSSWKPRDASALVVSAIDAPHPRAGELVGLGPRNRIRRRDDCRSKTGRNENEHAEQHRVCLGRHLVSRVTARETPLGDRRTSPIGTFSDHNSPRRGGPNVQAGTVRQVTARKPGRNDRPAFAIRDWTMASMTIWASRPSRNDGARGRWSRIAWRNSHVWS